MPKRILRTVEAAAYLGLAPATLERKRSTGDGPEFLRLGGRAVGYDVAALDRWLDEQRRSERTESGHERTR
jgi:predicted DNA-binding transcriptional regulator AlpA